MIKAQIIPKSNSVKPFPKLMIHADNIILATGYSTDGAVIGTLVSTYSRLTLGEYSEYWTRNFKDFNGSITLENK